MQLLANVTREAPSTNLFGTVGSARGISPHRTSYENVLRPLVRSGLPDTSGVTARNFPVPVEYLACLWQKRSQKPTASMGCDLVDKRRINDSCNC